jgi:AbrB family looped-hinge helix DNA binding protein
MEQVTISSKGQIAIPKAVRDALNLGEGTRLTVEVRGHEIILSKERAWKRLEGAGADRPELLSAFAEHRRRERERENSRP